MGNATRFVWLRRAELALAVLIVVYGGLFRAGYFSGEPPGGDLVEVTVIYGGLLVLPLALAVVSVLATVSADTTALSYLSGGVATVGLFGILGSWTLYFAVDSGVVIGPLVSFAFGTILAVVVLLKKMALRLRPHLAALQQLR